MSEKKRKRQPEKAERPKKKVAIDAAAENLKLSVLPNETQLCPVVASGLTLPPNIALKPWKRSRTGSKAYDLHLHSNTHPRLDYSADVQCDGMATNHLKHYIGVYEPSTGLLRVMDAQKVEIRSVLRPPEEELGEKKQAQTFSARRNALGMEFGTKKSKKAIAAVTENAITRGTAVGTTAEELKANPLAAAVLDSIAAVTNELPTKADVQAAVDASKPRPVPNLEATTPAEVYTLESLIGAQTLRDIPVKDWEDKAANNEEVLTTSRFVAKRLQSVVGSRDVRKLKAMRYILMLIDFFSALKSGKSKTGKRLPQKEELLKKMEGTSPALIEGIKRKFTEKGEMTKWHVDYLMTHIAALSLIVDNFDTDVYELKEDLRLEMRPMTQYYHELGCRTANLTQKEREAKGFTRQEAEFHKTAKLRLPLEFPKVRNPVSRKR